MIRALVFDFDGLIVDTEGPEYECWRELYGAHGCDLAFETWAATIGTADVFDPWADLQARAARPLDVDGLRARHADRLRALIEAEPLRPGVAAYLDEARRLGLRVGVASSSSRAWVAGHLGRLGLLERFETLCCAGDVPKVKPDPALYLAAVKALGVTPEEAIALEDSANGVRAAKRAGLYCVAVPNPLTARLDLSEADLRLMSLADLPLTALLARARR